jgi:hypothetical protein
MRNSALGVSHHNRHTSARIPKPYQSTGRGTSGVRDVRQWHRRRGPGLEPTADDLGRGRGFGNPNAPTLIHALDSFRLGSSRQTPDRLIFLIHAVRTLALSPKDRTSDEMATWVRYAVEHGEA